MYICVKTHENLDKLVQNLLRQNIAVDVSRHDVLTWVEAKLEDYGYLAYAAFYSKQVVIHSKVTHETLMTISFDDIEVLYSL